MGEVVFPDVGKEGGALKTDIQNHILEKQDP